MGSVAIASLLYSLQEDSVLHVRLQDDENTKSYWLLIFNTFSFITCHYQFFFAKKDLFPGSDDLQDIWDFELISLDLQDLT